MSAAAAVGRHPPGETLSIGPGETRWVAYQQAGQMWAAGYIHGQLIQDDGNGGLCYPHPGRPEIKVELTDEECAKVREAWPYGTDLPVLPSQDSLDPTWGRTEDRRGENEHAEPAEVTLLREGLLWGDAITRIPPPAPLVEGVLDLNSIAVLYGQPGHGKSFAAVDLACHVAAGRDWHGHRVRGARVLYLAAEDTAGLGLRFAAWETRHGRHERHSTHLAWLGRAVNLFDTRWADAAVDLAAELEAEMIVVDTLAKSMIGADENTSKDMGVVVGAVDRLRTATRGCVFLVHHMGKNRDLGMRGSNSLLAGVDTAWESTLEGRSLSLTCTRQKNHATVAKPLRFELSPSADSCVIQTTDMATTGTLHDAVRTTLAGLQEVQTPGGISTSVWLKAAGEVNDRTFYRHLKRLVDLELVTNISTTKTPRYLITDGGYQALGVTLTND